MDAKEREALEKSGFIISDANDPDFFERMYKEYVDSRPDLKSPSKAANRKIVVALMDFVDFIKTRLQQNPMTSFGFDERGTIIQFSDYTSVTFVSNNNKEQGRGTSVSVTGTMPGRYTNEFRQRDSSVPVTGVPPRNK